MKFFGSWTGRLLLGLLLLSGIGNVMAQNGDVQFSTASFSANESNSTIVVTVRRSFPHGESFSVSYATSDGSALANLDYIPTAGVLNFVSGQTNRTFAISLLNDIKYEGVESFNVHLSNPSNGVTLGTRSNAMVSIVDDESNNPGSVDGTFDCSNAANATVYWMRLTAGQKILMGGEFSSAVGSSRHGLAQLAKDGALDLSFNPALEAGSVINSAAESNGKIFIGGRFTTTGPTLRSNVARLMPNGDVDPGFNLGIGPDGEVRSIVTHTDGKLLIAGTFTNVNGIEKRRCARLNPDGSLDATFTADIDGPVNTLLVQPDGYILLGGSFSNVNGVARQWLARVGPNGTVDQTFVPGDGDTSSNGKGFDSLAMQRDGKIIGVGDFFYVYGGSPNGICRFLTNGTKDEIFDAKVPSGSRVRSAAIQPDGKILIGGDFFRLANPDLTLFDRRGIGRLNKDGSVDTSFNPGTASSTTNVNCVVVQDDLRVLACGSFTTFNGVPRQRVVRLYGDIPTRIKNLTYDAVNGVALQIENEPQRIYVLEASADAISWNPIATNTPTSTNFTFLDVSTQTNRLYRVIQFNP